MNRIRQSKKWLLPTILILLPAVGLFWRTRNEPFSKEKWDLASPEMRDRLLETLAESELLIGKSDRELYELLGEPDGGWGGNITYYFGEAVEGDCRPEFVVRLGTEQTVESQNLWCLQERAGDAVFESERWRMGTQSDRVAMVRSLIDSKLLIGRSRDEVMDILGPPDLDSATNYLRVWYTRRYMENGEIKKRHAGISRCLYIDIREGRVEKAVFVGS